jgi:hypothetical protein
MKIVVNLDEDGHFQAAKVSDREGAWLILKSILWGQFYEDLCEDYNIEMIEQEDIHKMSASRWEEYLWNFNTRGQFEILEV